MTESATPRRFGEFCRSVDLRAGDDARRLPLLSVTKERGVCLQSDTGRRQLGNPDLSTYKVARRGQFVLAPMALYYGAIGRLTDVEAGLVSPAYEVFEIDDSVDAAFFDTLIRSPALVAKYNVLSVGGNRAGKRRTTSFSDFCSIRWPIPTTATQRSVGASVETITADLRAHDALVRTRRKGKYAVMRELLTRGMPARRTGVRALERSWPIGRIDGPMTEIPTTWELVPLLEVSRLESGHTPSRQKPEYWNGDIPWLSLGDTDEIKRLVVERTSEAISELGIQNSSARLLPADTVVLTRTAVRGLASRLGRPMATSQDLVAFVCGSRLRPRYLVQVLRHMQREWRRLEAGTSPTNKTIYFADFERLRILLPPIEEQDEIAEVGEAFDLLIERESAMSDSLAKVLDACTRRLLDGRLQLASQSGIA